MCTKKDGKKYCALICGFILMIFINGCPNKKDSIKIGAILTLSGPGKTIGEEVRNGLLLAAEEVNAYGGISSRPIEIIIKDCKTDVAVAQDVFNEMESKEQPLVYVSVTSLISVALSNMAEEKKVPLIGLVTAAATKTLIGEKKWVFRTFPTPQGEVPPILSILKAKNIQNLGILYLNNEYGIGVGTRLQTEFESLGGIVQTSSFDGDTKDFRAPIEGLRKMEAIYIVGFDPHIIGALENLREIKYQGKNKPLNAIFKIII